MPKSRKPTDEELALLKAWMRDVKPIRHEQVDIPQKRPILFDSNTDQTIQTPLKHPRSKSLLIDTFENPLKDDPKHHYSSYHKTASSFFRKSVEHNLRKQLQNGKMPIGAQLDLHHHTLSQAQERTPDFLWQCHQQQIEVALIIHGKGNVLKHWLQYYLARLAIVLAFCQACPQHGAEGAVYVLLQTLLHEEKYR